MKRKPIVFTAPGGNKVYMTNPPIFGGKRIQGNKTVFVPDAKTTKQEADSDSGNDDQVLNLDGQ